VGFFGRFVYSEGQWREDAVGDEYLAIQIHDSDVATVDYRSAARQGRFYLGFQPRDYFEDPAASEPVDIDGEASRLALWAREVLGVSVTPAEIQPLLARAGQEEPDDAFVDETVERLLRLLDLPLPDELEASPGS
jgi:hypothetical protein